MKKWTTIEKGIQYLREIAVVEMLYDPMFVPNNLHQDCDPEGVTSMSEIHKKSTRKVCWYTNSNVWKIGGRMEKTPSLWTDYYILKLQIPPSHAYISTISRVTDKMEKQDGILEELSLDCDEHVVVSETPVQDQDD